MEKILQIGEGNFLRAFADYYVQIANDCGLYDGSVVICQPRKNEKIINALNQQGCSYDVILRGRINNKIVNERKNINIVSRCINTVAETEKLIEYFLSDDLQVVISNTTEAGIAFNNEDLYDNFPDVSFPGKIAYLLNKRFKAGSSGLVFLPVELIEDNGDTLKKYVLEYSDLWNFDAGFTDYINNECSFCNTLVDRIVTGHIDGDHDVCSVACEPYGSWIIQADDRCKTVFPFDKISNDIVFSDDLSQYRKRKVRILNGAHTMSVLAAYLCGFDIVRDMMNDKLFDSYLLQGADEIKTTLNLPSEDLNSFAESVFERFNNPFIDHKLLDISLNSVAKFKVRCLDTILDYKNMNGCLPKILTFSMAALIAFYTHSGSDREYVVNDNSEVLSFVESITDCSKEELVNRFLSNSDFWDIDLTGIDNFESKVLLYFNDICDNGIRAALERVVNE